MNDVIDPGGERFGECVPFEVQSTAPPRELGPFAHFTVRLTSLFTGRLSFDLASSEM